MGEAKEIVVATTRAEIQALLRAVERERDEARAELARVEASLEKAERERDEARTERDDLVALHALLTDPAAARALMAHTIAAGLPSKDEAPNGAAHEWEQYGIRLIVQRYEGESLTTVLEELRARLAAAERLAEAAATALMLLNHAHGLVDECGLKQVRECRTEFAAARGKRKAP